MKLYIVITPFFPTEESFRGPYVYDQVKAIQASGKFDKVIVFKPKSIFDKATSYIYDGIEVHLFPYLGMPSYILNGLTNDLNNILFFKVLERMKIKYSDISVVHSHVSNFASLAVAVKSKNRAVKALIQHHDRDPFTIRNGRFATQRWNTRYRAKKNIKLFNEVDCHISISQVVEDNLLSFPNPGSKEDYESYLKVLENVKGLSSISPKKSIVLYNGVDTSKFFEDRKIRAKECFRIGCIGNFQELKGQITLIKALEQIVKEGCIPNIKVSFIGSGPLLGECKDYIITNGLSDFVEFEEEKFHDKLREYYNSLDLFVLPTFYEGFGCVFTEAYACGVPFMLCENQGASEYIAEEEKERWLFSKKDFIRLSQLIKDYHTYRYQQTLKYPFQIKVLVEEFISKLDL